MSPSTSSNFPGPAGAADCRISDATIIGPALPGRLPVRLVKARPYRRPPWVSCGALDAASADLPCWSGIMNRPAQRLVDGRLVFLARHGETEWNRAGRWQGKTDIPLSEEGRAQARALGAYLAGR